MWELAIYLEPNFHPSISHDRVTLPQNLAALWVGGSTLWEHQMSDCFALVWAGPIVTGCTASHHVSVLGTTVIGTLVAVNGEFYKEGHKSELLRSEMGRRHMFLLFYHTLQRCLPTNNKRSHPVPIITDLFVPCVHILLHSYTSSQCFFWNILLRLAIWCAFLATKKTALLLGATFR